MAKNNFPQAGLEDVNPAAVREMVSSLRELHDMGRPVTDAETEQRINDYFSFCERSSIRPRHRIFMSVITYQQNNLISME